MKRNQPKLYVDEDACEDAVVAALRRMEIDVLTVLDVNRAGLDDVEQLRFATSVGRIIYSLNARHFALIHREFLSRGEEQSGIIVIPRQRYSFGQKVRKLGRLLDNIDDVSFKNCLHFL